MDRISNRIGRMLARYLDRPASGYEPFTPSNPVLLARALEPGDVLLVEGNTHIAGAIKYLTQSTWSHAALYVGPVARQGGETKTETKIGAKTETKCETETEAKPEAKPETKSEARGETETADGEPHELIEANIGEGVVSAPLSKYFRFHTRVCRPVGLRASDLDKVCRYAVDRIGLDYDVKNIIDLMRYLMPLPVPQRWRRHMIALGSGDPTRIICSALIAQAFESVRYPILPRVTTMTSRTARREILEIRHSSLYAPRDFDISPYFEVVKPTIKFGFDYKEMHWADLPLPPTEDEPAPARSLAAAKMRTTKTRTSKTSTGKTVAAKRPVKQCAKRFAQPKNGAGARMAARRRDAIRAKSPPEDARAREFEPTP
jgi:hypothetical protein